MLYVGILNKANLESPQNIDDMTHPKWKFPPHQAGYIAQEPIQREFFTTENMGGLARALVREAVQNALDARKQKPVGIRFATVVLRPEQYGEYLLGLKSHLEAIDARYVTIPDFKIPMEFLVVEDFNTTGLEGDPQITFLKDPQPGENFYYFWHNVGRTGKSGSNRGSWGLGKTVFPAISTMSTFFGLTARASDKRRLLMGQSVLRYHELKSGEPITPYGYFGVFKEGSKEQYFALPIEDNALINNFCNTFGLLRKSNQPGLSLVIPAPHDNINVYQLLLQSLQEYFYPILTGDLIIRVEGNDHGREVRREARQDNVVQTIDKIPSGVFTAASDFDKPAFLRLLDFMEWSLILPASDYIHIEPSNWKNAPQWAKYEIDSQLNEARRRFESERRVAFHVEVGVKPEGKKNKIERGWFYVYLERDEQLQRYESYFLRNGIWIKDVVGHKLRGIRGIVVIDGDDNPLARLLASAENPAHTEWQEQSNTLKSYDSGIYTLRFVRQSLARLGGKLTEIDKEVDQDLLRDIFFVERPEEERPQASGIRANHLQRNGKAEGNFPDIHARLQHIVSRPIKDGVEIMGIEGDSRVGTIEVQFAYAVRRGNAFQKYDLLDFDLARMTVETQAAAIERRENNVLRFAVEKPAFCVRVRGFDNLRDVEMRMTWKDFTE